MIGILDYGAGNLKNVCRALEYLGYRYVLITENKHFKGIDQLLIPGVGAFAVAMQQLNDYGLVEFVKDFTKTGNLVLGICLGMQMLFDKSYEFGETRGLSLLPGSVGAIPTCGTDGKLHKIPHIGWNELIPNHVSSYKELVSSNDSVYFVHSFMVEPTIQSDIVAHCYYNGVAIPALVARDNVLGCQFHPEKSGAVGLALFRKIMEMK